MINLEATIESLSRASQSGYQNKLQASQMRNKQRHRQIQIHT
jgi:hypothetical protein